MVTALGGHRDRGSVRDCCSSRAASSVFNSIPLLDRMRQSSPLLIWWLFAREMTAKTVQGARTRIAVLGFQEFMNRVDADRLEAHAARHL